MLTISVDSDAVQRTIDTIAENIDAISGQVPKEFLDWQAEDMHRKRPYAEVQDAKNKDVRITVASTRIWARGRSVHKGKNAQLDRKRGRRSHRTIHHRHRAHISTRPVLRQELFAKLVERMRALLDTIMRKP